MPSYAVTGASGHFGRHAVETLLDRGVPAADIVAVARTPQKIVDLAERGVQVRPADYSDPSTLPAALDGVRRVLLVSGSEVGNRVAEHSAVLDAAQAAGAERLLYTSILNADTTKNPLAAEHQGTEAAIRASGLAYTLLRNGWYTENYTGQLAQYLANGQILGAAGKGRVSGAPRSDFAEAAVIALTRDEDGDAVYELGGPSFDFDELAAAVTEATGTPVVYRDLPAPEYATALEGFGVDPGTAAFVASLDESIARGELETGRDDLARLLGRPVTPLVDAFRAAL
jgi:NAD(P)H dehydrogenase (quinone)